MATLRHRGEKGIVEVAKSLDAFRKIPEEYTESSQIGGTLSLLSRLLIVVLIYKEVSYYRGANLKFTFKPDIELGSRVNMHVDVTVAMPCIGIPKIDILDETYEEMNFFGEFKRENTWWELQSDERKEFEEMRIANVFLRKDYHSMADVLFKRILFGDSINGGKTAPERKNKLNKPHDACRLHGTLAINKVAGILRLVYGDGSLQLDFGNHGHWHGGHYRTQFNFTHRINKFSFGDLSTQIIQPLEGDERYISSDRIIAKYFIDVVPTEIRKLFSTINMYQYSVKENFRQVSFSNNSFGIPGLYFVYNWSALKVIVQQDRDNMVQFIIRLCSIIAGIVVISGIINSFIQTIHKYVLNLLTPQVFQSAKLKVNTSSSEIIAVKPSEILITNDLLVNANKMEANSIPL